MTSIIEPETVEGMEPSFPEAGAHSFPQSSWVLVRGVRWVWRTLLTEWRALPEQVWKQWLYTLTIGWILASLFAFGLSVVAQRMAAAGLFAWDEAALRWLTEAAPYTFTTAMYFGIIGDPLFLFVFVPTIAIIALQRGYPLRSLTIMATLFITDLIVFVSWQTWDRARPDILYGGIAAPPLHSFPSGHLVQALVVYGFLTYLWLLSTRAWGERVLALALCLFVLTNVAVTRLELGTHWPTDMLGAIPLGIVWLAALIIAVRQAEAVSAA